MSKFKILNLFLQIANIKSLKIIYKLKLILLDIKHL